LFKLEFSVLWVLGVSKAMIQEMAIPQFYDISKVGWRRNWKRPFI
jgi:hypothetical protein